MNSLFGRTKPTPHAVPNSTVMTSPRTDRRVLLNTGALAGSSLWRIGLTFVLQLLIANRLGAEGLGQYTAAMAYLNVCQVLSELGLPQLLVRDLARFPDRRRLYFTYALGLQLGASLLVWAALVALTLILPFQPSTQLALILVTASLPFYAISSVCETIFQAGERMELLMGVEMTTNALIVAVSILLLWRGGTVIHLSAVIIGTQAFSALLCIYLTHRHHLLPRSTFHAERNPWLLLRILWRKMRPFYALSLANVLVHRLDILLLSAIAGEVITGIYSAAYLVVRIFFILSQTFWQALYPTLSRLRQQSLQQYQRLAALGLRYGLIVLLFVAAASSGVAESLLGLIFRNEHYQQSVPVFQILVWTVPVFFLSTYAINLLLVERKPRYSLQIALVHLVIVACLLPLLSQIVYAPGAASAVLAAIVVSATVGMFWVHRTGITLNLPTRWHWMLLSTLLVAGSVHLLSRLAPSSSWPLHILGSAFLYLVLLWMGNLLSVQDLLLFRRALMQ